MKESEKCSYSGSMESISNPKYAPKYIRCLECGRRLKPRFYDCHYNITETEPCWHYKVPPHKRKGWWKKKWRERKE